MAAMRPAPILAAIVLAAAVPAAAAQDRDAAPVAVSEAERFRADARAIEPLVNRAYAYLDRFDGGVMPVSARLRAEAERVTDRRSLLLYAERALLALADHHAITGASFADSWAIVPSYADLWIERSGDSYLIEAVRDGSPAQQAGVKAGDRLVSVGGFATQTAVDWFWRDLGLEPAPGRAAFAARILAAGRRGPPRRMTIQTGASPPRALELPSLYAAPRAARPAVSADERGDALVVRIHDSLGDPATVAAFDAAMAPARPGQRVVIDLRDTPSGGNSNVARAILGWFVDRPTPFQIHSLPIEQRETGIARQWIEQVLPRAGKRHAGPVTVWVGRWTGSMGEGLAIAFDAIGARVTGNRMAGLLGAIHDHRLEHSGLIIKLPTERLMHVNGTSREAFVPRRRARDIR